MTGTTDGRPNWFEQGGRSYGLFRPDYPSALAAYLASIAPRQERALDAGCGTGQLTLQLAGHFRHVVGLDPSGEQLTHAPARDRVTWLCAPAEKVPLEDGSVDLITAAQAAHWFDLPAFYREAARLAAPEAVLALVSYGVLQLDDEAANARFARFYQDEIGAFWPPERRRVDRGYADLAFPFDEFPAPAFIIERMWNLGELLGYISTWSAVRRAIQAGREDILSLFAHELSALWGDDAHPRGLIWPVTMRIGRI